MMLLYFSPFILLIFHIHISLTQSIIDSNDTALELLHNCKCMHETQCLNSSSNLYGVGIISIRYDKNKTETTEISCSEPSFICCRSRKVEIKTKNKASLLENLVKPKPQQKLLKSKHADTCGKSKPSFNIRTIINPDGMSNVIDGEFPWITSIYRKNKYDDGFQFKCAGSLISDCVVLTAAHCFFGATKKTSEFKVLATGKKELEEIGEYPKQERLVEKIIVHPEYYAGGGHNDIALLILKNSYNESRMLNNICLPSKDTKYDKSRCIASGWGGEDGINKITEDTILRKIELPIIDHEKCQELLRKTRLGENFELHESAMCAGGEKSKDACKGDGGGPLICPGDNDIFYQLGIVSWGVNCGKKDQPGVYTDVTKFVDWIQENVQDHVPS